jgi:hypothetical protein
MVTRPETLLAGLFFCVFVWEKAAAVTAAQPKVMAKIIA